MPEIHQLTSENRQLFLANVKCLYNYIIGYLNIKSLRYKVVDLRHVLFESELDILAISETKLCDEFSDSQFAIEGCYHPAQFMKDRNYTWWRTDCLSEKRNSCQTCQNI